MSKITILDVAKKAGVSPATVSRVMNNGVCNVKTKTKVLNAINELGYVPNQSARNLASIVNKTRIAIIMPNENNFIYMNIIDGMKTITNIYGFDYNIFTFTDLDEYENIIQSFAYNTEYLGIIEIAPTKLIRDKIVISIFDQIFATKINSCLNNKKVYVNVTNDNILSLFLNNVLLSDIVTNEKVSADTIITSSIDTACEMLLEDQKAQIYTLEACEHASKLLNISYLHIDFFSIGVILMRYMIKMVLDQQQVETITINVGDNCE